MRFIFRWLRRFVISGLLLIMLYLLVSAGPGLMHVVDVWKLKHANPEASALMIARENEYRERKVKLKKRQKVVPYRNISPYLREAVRIGEDGTFFEHSGVDFYEMGEAFKANMKAGRFKRGASTITQQLVKNLYLNTSRTISRKVVELILTLLLEWRLDKARIFELYLNYIEWGSHVYGCESASWGYFNKSCSRLSVEEAIRLASITVNPRRYGPYTNSGFIKKRQTHIANAMLSAGAINKAQRDALPF